MFQVDDDNDGQMSFKEFLMIFKLVRPGPALPLSLLVCHGDEVAMRYTPQLTS